MMGHPINAHLNAIYFLLKRYRIILDESIFYPESLNMLFR